LPGLAPKLVTMRTAYFDCFGGASGDMIVAALLDAGLDLGILRAELAKLDLHGYRLSAERVMRGGLSGNRFIVAVEAHDHHGGPHKRGLSDIFDLLDRAGLGERTDNRARRIFRRLAEAESRVHGVGVDEIHFHEIGAVDSIIDIVGAAVGLELLGINRVVSSPIPLGAGTVECAHGTLPIPAPATAELMRDGEIAASKAQGELCTPTGAAVLTTLAESFGPLPAMTIEAIGYGAGGRDDVEHANMLRVFCGVQAEHGQADTVVELAANIDDTPGELIGAVLNMLLAAGAKDAWAVGVTMKKSRPGIQVGVLCAPADADRMEEILFRQTTTIGIRRHTCSRSKLTRRHTTVETPYGPVRVKVSGRGGTMYSVMAEFDDCASAAEAHNVPIKEVQVAAVEQYRLCGGEKQ